VVVVVLGYLSQRKPQAGAGVITVVVVCGTQPNLYCLVHVFVYGLYTAGLVVGHHC